MRWYATWKSYSLPIKIHEIHVTVIVVVTFFASCEKSIIFLLLWRWVYISKPDQISKIMRFLPLFAFGLRVVIMCHPFVCVKKQKTWRRWAWIIWTLWAKYISYSLSRLLFMQQKRLRENHQFPCDHKQQGELHRGEDITRKRFGSNGYFCFSFKTNEYYYSTFVFGTNKKNLTNIFASDFNFRRWPRQSEQARKFLF